MRASGTHSTRGAKVPAYARGQALNFRTSSPHQKGSGTTPFPARAPKPLGILMSEARGASLGTPLKPTSSHKTSSTPKEEEEDEDAPKKEDEDEDAPKKEEDAPKREDVDEDAPKKEDVDEDAPKKEDEEDDDTEILEELKAREDGLIMAKQKLEQEHRAIQEERARVGYKKSLVQHAKEILKEMMQTGQETVIKLVGPNESSEKQTLRLTLEGWHIHISEEFEVGAITGASKKRGHGDAAATASPSQSPTRPRATKTPKVEHASTSASQESEGSQDKDPFEWAPDMTEEAKTALGKRLFAVTNDGPFSQKYNEEIAETYGTINIPDKVTVMVDLTDAFLDKHLTPFLAELANKRTDHAFIKFHKRYHEQRAEKKTAKVTVSGTSKTRGRKHHCQLCGEKIWQDHLFYPSPVVSTWDHKYHMVCAAAVVFVGMTCGDIHVKSVTGKSCP